jgi:LCP family protein required for cell wall assembly
MAEATAPHRALHPGPPTESLEGRTPESRARRPRRGALFLGVVLGLCASLYLMGPWRTTVLLLGIDRAPEGTAVARSDTMILLTIVPPAGYTGMLSIPRDLWVAVPGVGANRINTAHFFGESQAAGSGPRLALDTVRQNFGLDINGFARVSFAGIVESVDALGGLVVELPAPMSGYDAGRHRLNGVQALAFVRDRAGSDDFFRMGRGQLFLRAVLTQLANPLTWPRLPLATAALLRSLETDVPPWEWPRLAFALARSGPDGIDGRTMDREMVAPFQTDQGAQVLAPNWDRINPVLMEMFGQ